jgi:hypothetical protein
MNLQTDLWKDRYLPLYKFHGNHKYFFKGLMSNFEISSLNDYNKYKGFRAFNTVWDGSISISSREISDFDRLKAISFMREEAKLALNKKKLLVVAYAPEYFKTNTLVKGKKEVLKDIEKLASEFQNVYFLDYNDWYGNIDVELFHNATHLNAKGATLFSETFSEDILEIMKTNKL